MNEITRPAMANPLGFLNTPTKEKITPNSQRNQPRKGIQPKNKATREIINPATPIPLLSLLV